MLLKQFAKYLLSKITKVKSYLSLPANITYLPISLVKAYNKSRHYPKFSKFCYAADSSIYFTFDGKVSACCFNKEKLYGIYPKQNLTEIWQSKQRRLLQKKLSKYDLSYGCKNCELLVKQKSFANVLAQEYDKPITQKRYPSILKFELENTCNLKCVMCNATFSSQHSTKQTVKIYDDNFVKQLVPFLKHAKQADFLGGEPFLIPVYYKIWDLIVKHNPKCRILVTTNGTILNNKAKQILEKGRFGLIVSIDSLSNEVYEKIRINADFDIVMQNLMYFKNICNRNNEILYITICPMTVNWRDIPELLHFAEKHKFGIYFNTVFWPEHLSLTSLNSKELQNIVQYYSVQQFALKSHIGKLNNDKFKDLIVQIKQLLAEKKLKEQQKETIIKQNTKENIESALIGFESWLLEGMQRLGNIDKELLQKIKQVLLSLPGEIPIVIGLNQLQNDYDSEFILSHLIGLSEKEIESKVIGFFNNFVVNIEGL